MGTANSLLEETLAFQIKAVELPEPVRQFRFRPSRKWMADFAWPTDAILVEVDGGTWNKGHHITGQGFEDDCEKINAATLDGYRVYRFTGKMVTDGRAIALLVEVFRRRYPK
jgi:very-short-patch-repair endonuclease